MTNKLMYIPNDETQIYPYFRLQLVIETFENSTYEPTNQNSIKKNKVVSQHIRKRYYKTYWDFCNKQPNVTSLPA